MRLWKPLRQATDAAGDVLPRPTTACGRVWGNLPSMRLLPCVALPVVLLLPTGCFNPDGDNSTEDADGTSADGSSTGNPTTNSNPTASSTSPGESTGVDPDGTTAVTTMSTDGTTVAVDDDGTSEDTAATTDTDSTSTGVIEQVCEDDIVAPGELCFDAATAVTATDVMYSPNLGDVTGDDISDLVFLIGDQIVVHPGTGNGVFGNAVFDETVFGTDAELIDVTEDGNLDVVLIGRFTERIEVATGDGSGAFQLQAFTGTAASPEVLKMASMTGDAIPDAVVGGGATGGMRVYESDGTGLFSQVESVSTGGVVVDVTTGDFNSDNSVDVVYSVVSAAAPIGLRLGDDTGNLGSQVDVSTTVLDTFGVAAGDVDNDGNDDLAIGGADSVAVLLGNGAAAFSDEILLTGAGNANFVVMADLTSDGFADVVATYVDEQTVSIWQSNGDGTFGTRLDIAIGALSDSLTVGDGNGDAVPDIVTGASNDELATIILSTP